MPNPTLTIRQMCDLFDVTPRTLRFYETKELLFPTRVGQKRLFTKRDKARMTLIVRGKKFGFSLEDIRQLLDMYSMDNGQITQLRHTIDIACERLAEMQSRRDELTVAICDLTSRIDESRVVLKNSLNQKKSTAKAAECQITGEP